MLNLTQMNQYTAMTAMNVHGKDLFYFMSCDTTYIPVYLAASWSQLPSLEVAWIISLPLTPHFFPSLTSAPVDISIDMLALSFIETPPYASTYSTHIGILVLKQTENRIHPLPVTFSLTYIKSFLSAPPYPYNNGTNPLFHPLHQHPHVPSTMVHIHSSPSSKGLT